jgi:hypothetical protein
LGRKRTDLFIEWPLDPQQGLYGPLQRIVIELKLLRGKLEPIIRTGLEQILDYSQQVGADEAHLVIFNRNPKVSWNKKIWQRQVQHQGWDVGVWGA